MKGYLSPERTDNGAVPIESRTEVYRDPARDQEVVVETETGVAPLGIADVTVSRKKGDDPPVVFVPQPESIEVRNRGNSNGVVVRTEGDSHDIEEGFSERVRRDAVIELGYQTQLRLTVERDARIEVSGGDYVAGDKVDNSTTVNDSVVNRSDIGPGQAGEDSRGDDVTVDDSVVNRSNVGGDSQSATSGDAPETVSETDTQNSCQTHGITYTGPVCPKCEAERSADKRTRKYCLFCGESIPAKAQVCPECGEDLTDV